MKILHVLAQLPSKTGSGVYYSNVIKGLGKNHQQACVFGYQEEYYFDLLDEKNQYKVQFMTDSLPFNIVGMSDQMPYQSTKYCDMTMEMQHIWMDHFKKTLHRAVEEFNPDVIICHHLWMLTALVVDSFIHCKIIGVCHGTDIRQCEKNPELKKKYVTNIHKLDMIFALSQLQVPEIMETYGVTEDKIKVIGGGFDENIFYPPEVKIKDDKIILIYAGKISDSKGVFQLVEAFPQIVEKHPNVYLEIIGARDEKTHKRMIGLLKNKKNIFLYNVQDQKRLGQSFRDGDIFILPSFYEGLGLVALESLATGLRVVSTHIDGLESLLGPMINASGVIEYVKLPRLYDVDKPVEQDLEEFRNNLAEKIILQVERIKNCEPVPPEVKEEIYNHSWDKIIERIEQQLTTG